MEMIVKYCMFLHYDECTAILHFIGYSVGTMRLKRVCNHCQSNISQHEAQMPLVYCAQVCSHLDSSLVTYIYNCCCFWNWAP